MGTRTIGSHSHPKSDRFSKQGTLYNLTLNEVQHQLRDLGKPLCSMNLDELIKSVWTAEGISHSQHNPQFPSPSSLDDLNLSKKTVDELWQDIQHKKKKKKKDNNNDLNLEDMEKELTLGDMTLEDFLSNAGVMKKNLAESIALPSPQENIITHQWMQFQIPPLQQHQQHVFMPTLPTGYSETQITVSPTPLMTALSDTQTPGRKRVASGDVREKTVERRQKRMIKNRESAARSRARKQAYTNELENKVSHLEEENERLKRDKEVENVLSCVPLSEPKYQLRRTSSALF